MPKALSIPWYESEDDFKSILNLIPFEESKTFIPYSKYIEWIKGVEQEQKNKGNTTFRVVIKPDAVKMWCEANDVIICRNSIANYAIAKMVESFHNPN